MSKQVQTIGELIHDRTNPRKHNPRNLKVIVDSLHDVGFARSIVIDENNEILAGNGVTEAAGIAGIERVIEVEADGNTIIAVRRRGLTDEQKQRLKYFDNRSGELAEWDAGQLLADMNAGVDLSGLFRDDELDALLADVMPKPEPTGDAEAQVDKAAELQAHWGTQLGQLWQLGEHRLYVGDSTNPQDVARLMRGEKADLLFTSPPYAQQRDYRDGATEKVSDWDALMQGVFGASICSDTCQILVNLGLVHREGEWIPYWDGWIEWMRAQGWRRFGWYVWDKLSGMPGDWDGRLAPSFEFIWHFNKVSVHPAKVVECKDAGRVVAGRTRGADGELRVHTGTKNGAAVQSHKIHDSVIRTGSTKGQQLDHPATFPIALPTFAIESWPGLVYEPFSGSGTTLIACSQLNRECRAMEISPAYAAVSIQRYLDAVGIEPVLIDTVKA